MRDALRFFGILPVLALALAGCGGQQASNQTGDAAPEPQDTRIELAVTEDGFVPARVTVPAGQPVTLVVTRKTDKTCATELVLKEHGINEKLPMNQPVEITFTPGKKGELTYACGMDMIKGVIAVQ